MTVNLKPVLGVATGNYFGNSADGKFPAPHARAGEA